MPDKKPWEENYNTEQSSELTSKATSSLDTGKKPWEESYDYDTERRSLERSVEIDLNRSGPVKYNENITEEQNAHINNYRTIWTDEQRDKAAKVFEQAENSFNPFKRDKSFETTGTAQLYGYDPATENIKYYINPSNGMPEIYDKTKQYPKDLYVAQLGNLATQGDTWIETFGKSGINAITKAVNLPVIVAETFYEGATGEELDWADKWYKTADAVAQFDVRQDAPFNPEMFTSWDNFMNSDTWSDPHAWAGLAGSVVGSLALFYLGGQAGQAIVGAQAAGAAATTGQKIMPAIASISISSLEAKDVVDQNEDLSPREKVALTWSIATAVGMLEMLGGAEKFLLSGNKDITNAAANSAIKAFIKGGKKLSKDTWPEILQAAMQGGALTAGKIAKEFGKQSAIEASEEVLQAMATKSLQKLADTYKGADETEGFKGASPVEFNGSINPLKWSASGETLMEYFTGAIGGIIGGGMGSMYQGVSTDWANVTANKTVAGKVLKGDVSREEMLFEVNNLLENKEITLEKASEIKKQTELFSEYKTRLEENGIDLSNIELSKTLFHSMKVLSDMDANKAAIKNDDSMDAGAKSAVLKAHEAKYKELEKEIADMINKKEVPETDFGKTYNSYKSEVDEALKQFEEYKLKEEVEATPSAEEQAGQEFAELEQAEEAMVEIEKAEKLKVREKRADKKKAKELNQMAFDLEEMAKTADKAEAKTLLKDAAEARKEATELENKHTTQLKVTSLAPSERRGKFKGETLEEKTKPLRVDKAGGEMSTEEFNDQAWVHARKQIEVSESHTPAERKRMTRALQAFAKAGVPLNYALDNLEGKFDDILLKFDRSNHFIKNQLEIDKINKAETKGKKSVKVTASSKGKGGVTVTSKKDTEEAEAKKKKEIEIEKEGHKRASEALTKELVGKTFPFKVGEDADGNKYDHYISVTSVEAVSEGLRVKAHNNISGRDYDMLMDESGNVLTHTRDGKTKSEGITDYAEFDIDLEGMVMDYMEEARAELDPQPKKKGKKKQPSKAKHKIGAYTLTHAETGEIKIFDKNGKQIYGKRAEAAAEKWTLSKGVIDTYANQDIDFNQEDTVEALKLVQEFTEELELNKETESVGTPEQAVADILVNGKTRIKLNKDVEAEYHGVNKRWLSDKGMPLDTVVTDLIQTENGPFANMSEQEVMEEIKDFMVKYKNAKDYATQQEEASSQSEVQYEFEALTGLSLTENTVNKIREAFNKRYFEEQEKAGEEQKEAHKKMVSESVGDVALESLTDAQHGKLFEAMHEEFFGEQEEETTPPSELYEQIVEAIKAGKKVVRNVIRHKASSTGTFHLEGKGADIRFFSFKSSGSVMPTEGASAEVRLVEPKEGMEDIVEHEGQLYFQYKEGDTMYPNRLEVWQGDSKVGNVNVTDFSARDKAKARDAQTAKAQEVLKQSLQEVLAEQRKAKDDAKLAELKTREEEIIEKMKKVSRESRLNSMPVDLVLKFGKLAVEYGYVKMYQGLVKFDKWLADMKAKFGSQFTEEQLEEIYEGIKTHDIKNYNRLLRGKKVKISDEVMASYHKGQIEEGTDEEEVAKTRYDLDGQAKLALSKGKLGFMVKDLDTISEVEKNNSLIALSNYISALQPKAIFPVLEMLATQSGIDAKVAEHLTSKLESNEGKVLTEGELISLVSTYKSTREVPSFAFVRSGKNAFGWVQENTSREEVEGMESEFKSLSKKEVESAIEDYRNVRKELSKEYTEARREGGEKFQEVKMKYVDAALDLMNLLTGNKYDWKNYLIKDLQNQGYESIEAFVRKEQYEPTIRLIDKNILGEGGTLLKPAKEGFALRVDPFNPKKGLIGHVKKAMDDLSIEKEVKDLTEEEKETIKKHAFYDKHNFVKNALFGKGWGLNQSRNYFAAMSTKNLASMYQDVSRNMVATGELKTYLDRRGDMIPMEEGYEDNATIQWMKENGGIQYANIGGISTVWGEKGLTNKKMPTNEKQFLEFMMFYNPPGIDNTTYQQGVPQLGDKTKMGLYLAPKLSFAEAKTEVLKIKKKDKKAYETEDFKRAFNEVEEMLWNMHEKGIIPGKQWDKITDNNNEAIKAFIYNDFLNRYNYSEYFFGTWFQERYGEKAKIMQAKRASSFGSPGKEPVIGVEGGLGKEITQIVIPDINLDGFEEITDGMTMLRHKTGKQTNVSLGTIDNYKQSFKWLISTFIESDNQPYINKTHVVELTPELVEMVPSFKKYYDLMEENDLDSIAFHSAVKVMNEDKITNVKDDGTIEFDKAKVMRLHSEHMTIQQDLRDNSKLHERVIGKQFKGHILQLDDDLSITGLFTQMAKNSLNEADEKFFNWKGDKKPLYQWLYEKTAKNTNAKYAQLKLLSELIDGKHGDPSLFPKLSGLLGGVFNSQLLNTIKTRVNGGRWTSIVAPDGMYKNAEGKMVKLLPPRKDPKTGKMLPGQALVPADSGLNVNEQFFATRIPTGDLSSAAFMEAVGFLPEGMNYIITDAKTRFLAGEDLDGDQRYVWAKNKKGKTELKKGQTIADIKNNRVLSDMAFDKLVAKYEDNYDVVTRPIDPNREGGVNDVTSEVEPPKLNMYIGVDDAFMHNANRGGQDSLSIAAKLVSVTNYLIAAGAKFQKDILVPIMGDNKSVTWNKFDEYQTTKKADLFNEEVNHEVRLVVADILSETADNTKNQNLTPLGINVHTAPSAVNLALFGMSLKNVKDYLKTPVIEEYVKRLSQADGNTSTVKVNDVIDELVVELLEKTGRTYKPNTPVSVKMKGFKKILDVFEEENPTIDLSTVFQESADSKEQALKDLYILGHFFTQAKMFRNTMEAGKFIDLIDEPMKSYGDYYQKEALIKKLNKNELGFDSQDWIDNPLFEAAILNLDLREKFNNEHSITRAPKIQSLIELFERFYGNVFDNPSERTRDSYKYSLGSNITERIEGLFTSLLAEEALNDNRSKDRARKDAVKDLEALREGNYRFANYLEVDEGIVVLKKEFRGNDTDELINDGQAAWAEMPEEVQDRMLGYLHKQFGLTFFTGNKGNFSALTDTLTDQLLMNDINVTFNKWLKTGETYSVKDFDNILRKYPEFIPEYRVVANKVMYGKGEIRVAPRAFKYKDAKTGEMKYGSAELVSQWKESVHGTPYKTHYVRFKNSMEIEEFENDYLELEETQSKTDRGLEILNEQEEERNKLKPLQFPLKIDFRNNKELILAGDKNMTSRLSNQARMEVGDERTQNIGGTPFVVTYHGFLDKAGADEVAKSVGKKNFEDAEAFAKSTGKRAGKPYELAGKVNPMTGASPTPNFAKGRGKRHIYTMEPLANKDLKRMAYNVSHEAELTSDEGFRKATMGWLADRYPTVGIFKNKNHFINFVNTHIRPDSPIRNFDGLAAALDSAMYLGESATQSSPYHEIAHMYWDAMPENAPEKVRLRKEFKKEGDTADATEERVIQALGMKQVELMKEQMPGFNWAKVKAALKKFWIGVKNMFGKRPAPEKDIDILAKAVFNNEAGFTAEHFINKQLKLEAKAKDSERSRKLRLALTEEFKKQNPDYKGTFEEYVRDLENDAIDKVMEKFDDNYEDLKGIAKKQVDERVNVIVDKKLARIIENMTEKLAVNDELRENILVGKKVSKEGLGVISDSIKKNIKTDNDEKYYTPKGEVDRITGIIQALQKPFEANTASYQKAVKDLGLSLKEELSEKEIEAIVDRQNELLAEWGFSNATGTSVHADLENMMNAKLFKGKVKASKKITLDRNKAINSVMTSMSLDAKGAKAFVQEMEDFVDRFDGKRVWAELTQGDNELNSGGTIDLLVEDSDGELIIYDFKFKKRGKTETLDEEVMSYKDPEIIGSPAMQYSIQTSMYSIMLQRAGHKVKGRYVVPIEADFHSTKNADGTYTITATNPNIMPDFDLNEGKRAQGYNVAENILTDRMNKLKNTEPKKLTYPSMPGAAKEYPDNFYDIDEWLSRSGKTFKMDSMPEDSREYIALEKAYYKAVHQFENIVEPIWAHYTSEESFTDLDRMVEDYNKVVNLDKIVKEHIMFVLDQKIAKLLLSRNLRKEAKDGYKDAKNAFNYLAGLAMKGEINDWVTSSWMPTANKLMTSPASTEDVITQYSQVLKEDAIFTATSEANHMKTSFDKLYFEMGNEFGKKNAENFFDYAKAQSKSGDAAFKKFMHYDEKRETYYMISDTTNAYTDLKKMGKKGEILSRFVEEYSDHMTNIGNPRIAVVRSKGDVVGYRLPKAEASSVERVFNQDDLSSKKGAAFNEIITNTTGKKKYFGVYVIGDGQNLIPDEHISKLDLDITGGVRYEDAIEAYAKNFGKFSSAKKITELNNKISELLKNSGIPVDSMGNIINTETKKEIGLQVRFGEDKEGDSKKSFNVIKSMFTNGYRNNNLHYIIPALEFSKMHLRNHQKNGLEQFLELHDNKLIYGVNPDSNLGALEPYFNGLISWTAWRMLAFNPSASIFNLAAGVSQNLINQNFASIAKGLTRFASGVNIDPKVKQAMAQGSGLEKATSILNAIDTLGLTTKMAEAVKKLDILEISIDTETEISKEVSGSFKNASFATISGIEMVNTILTIAGEMTSEEWNSYDKNFDLKEGRSGLTNKRKAELLDKVRRSNGAYHQLNRRAVNFYTLGRLIMQFKNWLPDMMSERFGSFQTNRFDEETQGRYNMLKTGIFSLFDALHKRDGKEAIRIIKSIKENDLAFENTKKLLTELFLIIALHMMAAGDDDRKDALRRMAGDIAFVLDVDNVVRMLNLGNLVPAFNTQSQAVQLLLNTALQPTYGRDTNYWSKGDAKAWNNLIQLSPYSALVKSGRRSVMKKKKALKQKND